MAEQDDTGSSDESILSPDELDITDDDSVVEIEEGRYVISSGGTPPSAPSSGQSDQSDNKSATDPQQAASGRTPQANQSAPDIADLDPETIDRDLVYEWLEQQVSDSNSQYGFDVTAKFEDSVSRQELFSNDVSTTFENLIVWYAQHVGGDTPVEEVLGILLMEATVSVRYPPKTLRALISAEGLSPEDSIADLLEAVEDRRGISYPP